MKFKTLKISQKGIDLIKQFEGCKLKAYKCPAGVVTIGYGHTKGVQMGDVITQEQAEQFLKDDLIEIEYEVNKRAGYWAVQLTQHQYDALVSFAFNAGVGAIIQILENLSRKTPITNIITKEYIESRGYSQLQLMTEKQIPFYQMLFRMYIKGGGVVLNGLWNRRNAEYLLFIS